MNSASETNLVLALSIQELQWLASAFGLAQLPLPPEHASHHRREQGLQDGRLSLQQRGLIQGQGVTWQVDPAAAMLIPWMINAPAPWQYCHTRRSGQVSYWSFFPLNRRMLLVRFTKTGCQFFACPTLEAGIQEWQSQVGLKYLAVKGDRPVWDLPQPLVIIRSYWRDPQLACQMTDSNFLPWAAGVEATGEWSRLAGKHWLPRISIAEHRDGTWAGSFTPNRPGECILRPVSSVSLACTVVEMIAA